MDAIINDCTVTEEIETSSTVVQRKIHNGQKSVQTLGLISALEKRISDDESVWIRLLMKKFM